MSSENIVDQETDNPELEQTLKEQQHDAFLFFVRNLWYFFLLLCIIYMLMVIILAKKVTFD